MCVLRRWNIAALIAFLLCLTAAPAAYAAEPVLSAPVSSASAPLAAQKAPVEVPSTGALERCTQQVFDSGRAAELWITTPETFPKAGEAFPVTVDISGNPGFAGVQFTLAYDRDAMECVSADAGDLMRGMLTDSSPAAADGAVVAGIAAENIQGDGCLAVITFIVRQDLSSCDFRLTDHLLTDTEGGEINCTVTKADKKRSASAETQRGPSPLFVDMSGHWAEEDARRAVDLGILNGYDDGTFRPDAELTRAQFVAILYRRAGNPAVAETAPFADIAEISPEFQKAIAWAYGEGLVDGAAPAAFSPDGALSRQAAMKILFRHSGGAAGEERMLYGVYDGLFPDSGSLAAWAREPVYWGMYNTLIEAGEKNALNPAEPVTRAQLARSMVRYIDRFGGEETR